ncbi:MAG: T9SS type A sorting domain-containing protein [Gemmatimonadetes bacterium]|nr:T9SS type A sorting domain-containing protein [Gemmatimonadota bacterium]
MKTRTLPTSTSMIPVVGLLVLACAFFVAHPALAQTELDCPLPPDWTPPPVTAEQVENGSASLKDFALVMRDQSRDASQGATGTGQLYSSGCLLRQEGGPYRFGSTYLVQLTPTGRVRLHGKDMTLSGRLLKPRIYLQILSSLGVPATVLANLVSPDPDTVAQAQAAVTATLSQEPDTAFDATVSSAVGPGIPGASGYASVYSTGRGTSDRPALIIQLAGFDLNASHLVEEIIDYGDPAITAKEVVDRETLKAFVTEAAKYFRSLRETGGPGALLKAKVALRDPNGPWRHGNVYLYIVDSISNIIVFHGAFPDRFELRPPGISRDVVTGELIADQIDAAAASGPEGGFWQYHFDNPTDDTDSADIPKVGYAFTSAGQIPRADGSFLPTSYIFGSGFYRIPGDVSAAPLMETEVEATVLGDAVEGLTVEFSRAIAGHPPNYVWSAVSDANGHAVLTVSSAVRRVSGYYQARARNAAGEVVGHWHSIPLNRDRRQVLELPLDGAMRLVSVEPLVAAKAVAATSGLAPNVPNPFNSATQIAYHLSSSGPVRLAIYNVLGQPVRTLVDQFQAAGSYQVQWDARDQRGVSLSSGVYITRLSYPGGEQTRRLLYLK